MSEVVKMRYIHMGGQVLLTIDHIWRYSTVCMYVQMYARVRELIRHTHAQLHSF